MANLKKIAVRGLVVAAVIGGVAWALLKLDPVRRFAVWSMSPTYVAPEASQSDAGIFDGADAARTRLPVALVKVAEGFNMPTDVQFVPGRDDLLVVAQKAGRAQWLKLGTKEHGTLFTVDVVKDSEMGLLGIAFHPRFEDNGKLYANYNTEDRGKFVTRVSEWQVSRDDAGNLKSATELRALLQVEQPYQNHNAGQLAFGPDGFLYIGTGDGGFRDDPDNHGQDKLNWLGKMLRIDVDNAQIDNRGGPVRANKPYAVPRDNPFIGDGSVLPEVWAYGLRNPWRYSFAPDGRLVIADVGQDKWEEVSIAERGDNLGWKVREGNTCFVDADCKHSGMKEPVYVYGHDEGQSITGGFVYTADDFPALHNKYVFADFVSGRFWAINLPGDPNTSVGKESIFALGRFSVLPSSFGRDAAGHVYVADFASGAIFQLQPVTSGATP